MPTIPKLKDYSKTFIKPLLIRSATYYNKPEWKRLRDYYIRLHPLCEECLAKDKITAADHVHHKRPFMEGMTHDQRMSLLLDIDNLESVCKSCHNEIHYGSKETNKDK